MPVQAVRFMSLYTEAAANAVASQAATTEKPAPRKRKAKAKPPAPE